MELQSHQCNTVFVLFGATGDLAHRKILPALFNLFLDGQLAQRFTVVGVGRSSVSETELRDGYYVSGNKCSSHSFDSEKWQEFANNVTYKVCRFICVLVNGSLTQCRKFQYVFAMYRIAHSPVATG